MITSVFYSAAHTSRASSMFKVVRICIVGLYDAYDRKGMRAPGRFRAWTPYQSDCAIAPPCRVCGLHLPMVPTIAAKSPQDFCACAQWSWMPATDS